MAAAVPSLTRDSTMKITAEEGINYLKKEGENTLLKMQGLVTEPTTTKTASETKPAPTRDNTMVGTAKEAEGLLASMGGAPDTDAATRAQAKKIDELSTPPPPAKKSKVKRDNTMAATAKDGEEFLERSKKPRKSPGHRQSTIAKCIAESKDIVPEVNLNEGRRTRNAGKSPAPAAAAAKKPTPRKRAPRKKKTSETELAPENETETPEDEEEKKAADNNEDDDEGEKSS